MNTEALKKQDFLPVLLGSDINVYGMARSFHEAYGYKSVAVGKGILPACTHSHIVEVLKVEPRLEEDDVFVRTLTEFAKNFSGQRLLLVPCGDNYIKMLVRNQTKLRGIYEFECIIGTCYSSHTNYRNLNCIGYLIYHAYSNRSYCRP